MLSQEKVLEHLEPVIFTAVTCLILYLIVNYCPSGIVDLANLAIQASPMPRIGRLLEPYITSARLRLNQWVENIDHWIQAQQITMDPNSSFKNGFDIDALETPIKPLTSFIHPSAPQHDSPLFNLPTEIIDVIATYVLTPHQDLEKAYDSFTCYRRPGNLAPTKISTSLLQTCQFFYSTYWYLPWTLSTHNFYLSSADRRPETTTTVDQMTRTSHLIAHLHANAPARRKEVSHVQVFPQLYALENGRALSQILKIPHFMPRTVTITIRHTDWWFWEDDAPMAFHSTAFVANAMFPVSTTTVNIEMESLERRKPQVDWIADYISRNWHFTRSDDVHLVADSTHIDTNSWQGAATWGGQRWIRDEDDAEPNVLKYYIRTVAFRAVSQADDVEGYETRNRRNFFRKLDVDPAVAAKTRIQGGFAHLRVAEMERAGIRDGDVVKASEAARMVNEFRTAQMAERLARER